jgi:hypothetical protein
MRVTDLILRNAWRPGWQPLTDIRVTGGVTTAIGDGPAEAGERSG